jgi:hypothetical protein
MIEITRQEVIEVAYSWIDTPYRLGQASRAGCDCLGLVRGVASELGVEIFFDLLYQEDQQDLDQLIPELLKYEKNDDGEIIVNQIKGNLHFGIYTEKSLIHCTRLRGVHEDTNPFWFKKPFYRTSLLNLV